MSKRQIIVEAPSVAAFSRVLAELDHELRAIVTATENGRPWATVEVSPLTDSTRAFFPTSRDGVRGDTRRRSEAGVIVRADGAALPTVIQRARRFEGIELVISPNPPSATLEVEGGSPFGKEVR